MAIARPVIDGDKVHGGSDAVSGDWPLLFPTVVEFMTAGTYADGSKRETATVLLFMEEGVCKLCLNDRDTGRTAWASASSVEGAVAVMEERLAGGRVDWRASRGQVKRKGK